MGWRITWIIENRPELLEQGLLALCAHRLWDHTGRYRKVDKVDMLNLLKYGALHVSQTGTMVRPDLQGFCMVSQDGRRTPWNAFAWSPDSAQAGVIAKRPDPENKRHSMLEKWLKTRDWTWQASLVGGYPVRVWFPPRDKCVGCPLMLQCTMLGRHM